MATPWEREQLNREAARNSGSDDNQSSDDETEDQTPSGLPGYRDTDDSDSGSSGGSGGSSGGSSGSDDSPDYSDDYPGAPGRTDSDGDSDTDSGSSDDAPEDQTPSGMPGNPDRTDSDSGSGSGTESSPDYSQDYPGNPDRTSAGDGQQETDDSASSGAEPNRPEQYEPPSEQGVEVGGGMVTDYDFDAEQVGTVDSTDLSESQRDQLLDEARSRAGPDDEIFFAPTPTGGTAAIVGSDAEAAAEQSVERTRQQQIQDQAQSLEEQILSGNPNLTNPDQVRIEYETGEDGEGELVASLTEEGQEQIETIREVEQSDQTPTGLPGSTGRRQSIEEELARDNVSTDAPGTQRGYDTSGGPENLDASQREEVEAAIDEQVGPDLERGEDYTIQATERGIDAELTDQYRTETAREQAAEEFSDELGRDLSPSDIAISQSGAGTLSATLTSETQRDIASDRAETQLQEETGENLVAGEDFTLVEGEDGGFTTELTDEGERTLSGDEFEDEVTGFEVPWVVGEAFGASRDDVEGSDTPGFIELEFGDLPGVEEEDATLEDVVSGTAGFIEEGAETIARRGVQTQSITSPVTTDDASQVGASETEPSGQGVRFLEGVAKLPAFPVQVVGAAEEVREFGLEAESRRDGVPGLNVNLGSERIEGTTRSTQDQTPTREGIDAGGTEQSSPSVGIDDDLGVIGFTGEEATETAQEVGSGITESLSSPGGRAEFAGSLLGTAGVMSAGRAISPSAGAATRYAIQPGEELVSAGLTRTFPSVARRFPNNRIDNEEILISGAGRVASGVQSRVNLARDVIRGDAELRPTTRQSDIIDLGRPGAAGGAIPTRSGEFGELERAETVRGGATSEPLGSPTQDILEGTTRTSTRGPSAEVVSETGVEGTAEGDVESRADDEIPLLEEIQEAGGTRPFLRGEELPEQIRPTDMADDVRDWLEAGGADRGQATLAQPLGRQRGEVEPESDTQTDLDAIQEGLRRQQESERTLNQQDIDPDITPFRGESERTTRSESPEVETETETRLDARSEILSESGGRQAAQANLEDALDPIESTVQSPRTDVGIDTQLETALETEQETEQELEQAFETELETETEAETEAELEQELETELELESETETEVEAEPFADDRERSDGRDSLAWWETDEQFGTGISDVDDLTEDGFAEDAEFEP